MSEINYSGCWLPIETAPKDGRRVLLAASDFHGALEPIVGWWDEDNDEWACGLLDHMEEDALDAKTVVMWMPIPEVRK